MIMIRDVSKGGMIWIVVETCFLLDRTNIPGNDVGAGKEICHYFPPFPAKGTGYHRFTFLLFKQDRLIDFSEDVRPTPWYAETALPPPSSLPAVSLL